MEGEGKFIVKFDVGRRSYMTIFVIGVIFAKFNGGCVVIFAEVPVVIFTKFRGGVGGGGEFNSAT